MAPAVWLSASRAIQVPSVQALAKQRALDASLAATVLPIHQQPVFSVVQGRSIRTTARTAAGLACCAHLAAMPPRVGKLHAPYVQQERTIQQPRQPAAVRALRATQALLTPAAAKQRACHAVLEPTAPRSGSTPLRAIHVTPALTILSRDRAVRQHAPLRPLAHTPAPVEAAC